MSNKNHMLRFECKDFANAPQQELGKYAHSNTINDSDGSQWTLKLKYDEDAASGDDGPLTWVFVNLLRVRDRQSIRIGTTLTARVTYISRNAIGGIHYERSCECEILHAARGSLTRGIKLRRSHITDEGSNVLVNGSLLIDVYIQIKPSIHIPANPFGRNMLQLLDDDEDADVTFMVKRTPVRAHKLILKMNAPVLYEFCEGVKEGKNIPIKEVTPKTFKTVLQYVYGGDVPDTVTIETGKELIIAADRYGVTGFKLAVETTLVQALMLENDNLADWLMFADSMALPLLKEYAVSYFVDRATDLTNSEHMETLNQSPKLMNELMAEVSSRLVKDSRFDNTGKNMSVNELRKSLDEEGLDVDGSKEMLVSRYQENKRQRTS